MKKFIVFVSLLFMLLIYNINSNAKAFDWWNVDDNTSFEVFSMVEFQQDGLQNWYMRVTVPDISTYEDISYLDIFIPEDVDVLANNGAVPPFSFFMYDVNGDYITAIMDPHEWQLDDAYVDPTRPYGHYYIDINGINQFHNTTVDEVIIKVPTTLDVINANVDIYFRDNVEVYRRVLGVYDYTIKWELMDLTNNYKYMYTDIPIDFNRSINSFFLPYSNYHVGTYDTFNSKIDYYDYSMNLVCSYDISEKAPYNKIIDINPINNNCSEYVDQIKKVRIFIIEKPLNYSDTELEYIEEMNAKSKVSFDHDLYLVNVYNSNVLLTQNAYGYNELTGDYRPYFRLKSPPQYINESMEFQYFAYVNGVEYKTERNLGLFHIDYYGIEKPSDRFFIDNTLNLYAVFKVPTKEIPTTTDKNVDDNFQNVVNAFGFDNIVGWTILYFVIILLADIAIYFIFKNNLIILIFNIIVTGFFTYLGVLSILIQIILYALLFVLTIIELRKE